VNSALYYSGNGFILISGTNINQRKQSVNDILVEIVDVGVTKVNPAGQNTVILDRISFSAREGEITGIIGASGSGKSTLRAGFC